MRWRCTQVICAESGWYFYLKVFFVNRNTAVNMWTSLRSTKPATMHKTTTHGDVAPDFFPTRSKSQNNWDEQAWLKVWRINVTWDKGFEKATLQHTEDKLAVFCREFQGYWPLDAVISADKNAQLWCIRRLCSFCVGHFSRFPNDALNQIL